MDKETAQKWAAIGGWRPPMTRNMRARKEVACPTCGARKGMNCTRTFDLASRNPRNKKKRRMDVVHDLRMARLALKEGW